MVCSACASVVENKLVTFFFLSLTIYTAITHHVVLHGQCYVPYYIDDDLVQSMMWCNALSTVLQYTGCESHTLNW